MGWRNFSASSAVDDDVVIAPAAVRDSAQSGVVGTADRLVAGGIGGRRLDHAMLGCAIDLDYPLGEE